MTRGVEYPNLLRDDEGVVNKPFTFVGSYSVKPNGTGKAKVDVTLPDGTVIHKTVWFVLGTIGKDAAHEMSFAHLPAVLGGGLQGRAGVHHAHRIR